MNKFCGLLFFIVFLASAVYGADAQLFNDVSDREAHRQREQERERLQQLHGSRPDVRLRMNQVNPQQIIAGSRLDAVVCDTLGEDDANVEVITPLTRAQSDQ